MSRVRSAAPTAMWPVAAVAVAAAIVVALFAGVARGTVAQDATDAGTPAPPSGDVGKAEIAEMPVGATVYEIGGDTSTAGYTVKEQLVGVGDTEAIGTTTSVLGEIVVDASGNPLAGSRIDIDLRTLKTDQTRRDNYLRTNSLESDSYPLATFVLTRVDDWTGPLAEGTTSTFKLVGNLTVHGVTKEVSWDASATKTGDDLTGTATVTVVMGDFDIAKPSVGMVLGLDENVKLDLTITGTPADS